MNKLLETESMGKILAVLSERAPDTALGWTAVATTAALCMYALKKKKPPTLLSADGKCVLVTGCDTGFGNLLTHRLLEEGYTVVAACYTKAAATKFEELGSKQIVPVVADLSTKEGRTKVVAVASEISKKMGGLYAIVNNAGVALPGNVEWLEPKYYEDSMNLMFHAPVELTYGLLPLLKKKKGRVVNVSSVCGMVPSPFNSAYSAAKHALESWSDCLRCEMQEWGVKVVVIQPSTMKTPLVMSYYDKYRDIFLQADPERKSPYGGKEWIDAIHQDSSKSIAEMAEDPMVTANDLLQALQLEDPPARIKSGAAAKTFFSVMSWLPDKTRDNIYFSLSANSKYTPRALQVTAPPTNKICHATIVVSNLQTSINFYEKFGFSKVGESLEGKQFLKGGECSVWKPLILLVEDPTMPPREECYEIGQTRLSLYSADVAKDVEDLKAKGIEVSYPVTQDGQAILAVYKDPDGFIIYIAQFKSILGLFCRFLRYKYKITNPSTFHWTLNIEDSSKVNAMFEKLGFKPMSDQNKDQIQDDLLPAFGLEKESTVFEHIRLATLPEDNFVLTTMEWVAPKSTKNGQELLNRVSICVENVSDAVQKAKDAGMIVSEDAIKTVTLPLYGEVEVGTVYVEEGSNPIEFVAF